MPTALIIGGVVSAGTSAFNAYEQANAAGKATQAQTQAAQAAMAQQNAQYQQTRADLAPFRSAGVGAVGKLADIFGVSMPASASATGPQLQMGGSLTPGAIIGNNPIAQRSTIAGPGALVVSKDIAAKNGGLVPVQAPDGNIYHVPQAQVGEAMKNGGKVVA